MRNADKFPIENPERKRYLGRQRYRFDDDIKIDVKWIYLSQDRGYCPAPVNTIINIRVS
jgi:hypothetical protein